ncbi:AraC family transcriptional regulator [Dongia deserti]|uniref:AraC family transcriptional regulator n=1 Tax=Dongia deserti TaxID=2268030 RepID=UPI000E650649|nr:AraC family transcriptional regulator [Dongia deserti]
MTRAGNNHWIEYGERMDRVTAYVFDHLDDELDLNKLAEVACLSPYHWHRIYHAMRGETIATTVRRLRLHRATGWLTHTDRPIEEIAEKSGFGGVESFTRAFKAAYGMPPAKYRREGSHRRFDPATKHGSSTMQHVEIRTLPQMQAVTIPHRGSYMEIGRAFEKLFGVLGARNLLGPGLRMFGIYYDDPASVPQAELRSRAAIIAPAALSIEPPLEPVIIAAGEYAVLRHKGPYADMRGAYEWLYGTWLPQSAREPADAPCVEEYLNTPRDTPPTELISDIYLPLK